MPLCNLHGIKDLCIYSSELQNGEWQAKTLWSSQNWPDFLQTSFWAHNTCELSVTDVIWRWDGTIATGIWFNEVEKCSICVSAVTRYEFWAPVDTFVCCRLFVTIVPWHQISWKKQRQRWLQSPGGEREQGSIILRLYVLKKRIDYEAKHYWENAQFVMMLFGYNC